MKEVKTLKVLFDSNVIIDVFTKSPSSNSYSLMAFRKAITYEIEAYISSKQLTDIYYVLRKYEADETKRKEFIRYLTKVFIVLPFNREDIELALTLKGKYFEDNTLIATSIHNNLDAIVTSNKKDFNSDTISIFEPKDI